jgi:hypothetical protein
MGNESIRRAFLGTIDGGNFGIYTNTTNTGTVVTERLTITSAGNVGIGTRIGANTDGTTGQFLTDGTNTYLDYQGSLIYRAAASSVERMRLTTEGNVGIGAIPSAWSVGYKALQGSFVTSYAFDQNVPANIIVSNAYNDGTWKYGITAPAAKLNVVGWTGVHTFEVAASGTAGAAITWLERVRIDVDGLKFNGDTAAANALDDYEEGTWTPTFGGTTFSGTNAATYTKIGRLVTVQMNFVNQTLASSAGTASISGLPFACNSSTFGIVSFTFCDALLASVASGYVGVSGTAIQIRTNTGINDTSFVDGTSNRSMMLTATYFV